MRALNDRLFFLQRLGTVADKKGDEEAAAKHFSQALDLIETNREAIDDGMANRTIAAFADFCQRRGRDDDAVRAYEALLASMPTENADIAQVLQLRLNLATMLMKSERHDHAIAQMKAGEDFLDSRSDVPYSGTIYNFFVNYGEFLFKTERYDDAERVLSKAVSFTEKT